MISRELQTSSREWADEIFTRYEELELSDIELLEMALILHILSASMRRQSSEFSEEMEKKLYSAQERDPIIIVTAVQALAEVSSELAASLYIIEERIRKAKRESN